MMTQHRRYSCGSGSVPPVTPAIIVTLAMFLFAAVPSVSQDAEASADDRPILRLGVLVETVLSENRNLVQATLEQRQAESGYESARAAIGPQVDLDVDVLGVDSRRVPAPGGTGGAGGGGAAANVTNRTTSSGVSLRFTQALPTGGRLSAETSAEARHARTLAEDDATDDIDRYEIEPSFNLRFSQPVFVGGRLVDTRISRSVDTQARTGVRIAELTRADLENRFALAAVELYYAVSELRRAVAVQEERLSIARRQLERVADDVEAGTAGRQQVLQLQLAENRRREGLLQTREQLRSLERRLERLAGGAVVPDEYRFATPDDVDALADAPAGDATNAIGRPESQWDVSMNPDLRRSTVSAERAEAELIANRADRAGDLSLFYQVARRYPDTRDDPSDAATAFGDLFDEGGGFNWTVGISITIPLFDGGRRRNAEEADRLAVDLAALDVEQTEADVRDEVATLVERLSILSERVELRTAEVAFEDDRVANVESLVEINAATDVEREEALVDRLEARNARSEAVGQLALALLELESVLGGSVAARVRALEAEQPR